MKRENTNKIRFILEEIIPPIIRDSFIFKFITKKVMKNKNLENPGSLDLLKKYDGDKAGLPFWLILDNNLALITDSNDNNGQNLGAPGSAEEVEVFLEKIKKSAIKITQKDVINITNQFVMKK